MSRLGGVNVTLHAFDTCLAGHYVTDCIIS